MHIKPVSIASDNVAPASIPTPYVLPALLAAVLGLTLVFAAGFAETHVLHSATHDTRHSAGFPCH